MRCTGPINEPAPPPTIPMRRRLVCSILIFALWIRLGLSSSDNFSRPLRDCFVLLVLPRTVVLGYVQPSLRGLQQQLVSAWSQPAVVHANAFFVLRGESQV